MAHQITAMRHHRVDHNITENEIKIATITDKYRHASGRRYMTKEMTAILKKSGIEPVREPSNGDINDTVCRIYDKHVIDLFFASERGRRVCTDRTFNYREMPVIKINQTEMPLIATDDLRPAQSQLIGRQLDLVAQHTNTPEMDILIPEITFQALFTSMASAQYRTNRMDELGLRHVSLALTPVGTTTRMYRKSDVVKFLTDHARKDTIDRSTELFNVHFAEYFSGINAMSAAERAEYESLTARLATLHTQYGPSLGKATIERLS